jgi:hypothetical protein
MLITCHFWVNAGHDEKWILYQGKNKMNEEYREGLMSKIRDSWDNEIFEFLGCIKILLPHIPDLHTTTLLFRWECMVIIF